MRQKKMAKISSMAKKNSIVVKNVITTADEVDPNLKSYFSYGVQEVKEYDGRRKLVDNLKDLKIKLRKLRTEFPADNAMNTSLNFFEGHISSTIEIQTTSVLIKLSVLTQTEIGQDLRSYFETVVNDHYECVLQGKIYLTISLLYLVYSLS
jgi:hypothetical protein